MKKIVILVALSFAGIFRAGAQTRIVVRPAHRVVVVIRPRVAVVRPVVVRRRVVVVHP